MPESSIWTLSPCDSIGAVPRGFSSFQHLYLSPSSVKNHSHHPLQGCFVFVFVFVFVVLAPFASDDLATSWRTLALLRTHGFPQELTTAATSRRTADASSLLPSLLSLK